MAEEAQADLSCQSSSDETVLSEDTLSFSTNTKRPRLSINFTKCLKCQTATDEKLSQATSSGIERFCTSAIVRKDEVYDRLKPHIATLRMPNNLTVKWHPNCYKKYTSKTNVEHIQKNRETSFCHVPSGSSKLTTAEPASKMLRSSHPPLSWNLCMFCQKVYDKNDKKLCQILTSDGELRVKQAAKLHNDVSLLAKIAESDLIAYEAKYHKRCHRVYTKVKLDPEDMLEEHTKEHQESFLKLVSIIDNDLLKNKKAFDTSILLTKYKNIGADITGIENYRTEKLKQRLLMHYGGKIIFQPQTDRSKPELVYSSDISLADAINTAAKMRQEVTEIVGSNSRYIDEATTPTLFHAALILRDVMRQCDGIDIQPLNLDDLTQEKASQILPDSLYMFLKWSLEGDDYGISTVSTEKQHSNNSRIHRQILSIGQDLVYAASRGKIRTPKHITLVMTTKHLTRSKELVTILNRAGHCVSYDEIQRVDTSMAEQLMDQYEDGNVVIPSNIYPEHFVHAAADNIDINEETLDGLHTTHATSTVLYQQKGHFGKLQQLTKKASSKTRSRSLTMRALTYTKEFSAAGRRPSAFFKQTINMDWFHTTVNAAAMTLDMTWLLIRLCPQKLFDMTLIRDPKLQNVPGWSAFNAVISARAFPASTIGYCPLLHASPTEYSTVYTVMTNVKLMMRTLKQEKVVITFDEAIYCKAKEIQWRRKEEFENVILRMGGFHLAMNYIRAIGQCYEESGLEDILIEAGLYGSSTVNRIVKGKSYNRAVRAHKLMFEAMMRLRWAAFCKWIKDTDINLTPTALESNVQACHSAMESDDGQETILQTIDQVVHSIEQIQVNIEEFVSTQMKKSQTFAYWEEYIKMIELLLQYIRAEREGLWELHLSTTAAMLPYFFACGHVNYARWVSVYIADMRLLPTTSPAVHREFEAGGFGVRHTDVPFNQVWSDMALEQSVNRHVKSRGGVIGFSTQPLAMQRWFLTAHLRASIAGATRKMFGVDEHRVMGHKEAGSQRMLRDETAVQRIIEVTTETMTNPFDVALDDMQLINIVTGTVARADVASDLLHVEATGLTDMDAFVEQRLMTMQVPFFEAIKKNKLSTFASMRKQSKVKSKGDTAATLSGDRDLFSRILVVATSRKIDLKHLLTFELSPVPLSLAKLDGTLHKTAKSQLIGELEKLVEVSSSLPDTGVDTACIVDGMALIQMRQDAGASTFGELARNIYESILQLFKVGCMKRVDVVFDRYDQELSIKNQERERRYQSQGFEVHISGPNTSLPKQWSKFLSNPKNKANLAVFISTSWQESAMSSLDAGKILVLAGGFSNGKKVVLVRDGSLAEIQSLASIHEEADTRLLLHAAHSARTFPRVVVWSPDTDVAVLCVHFQASISTEIWFRTGVRDRARYIPIRQIARNLGQTLCMLLPSFHALTGCDTTSNFRGRGKIKAWQILRQDVDKFQAIQHLGDDVHVTDEVQASVESFVTALYDKKDKDGDVNQLRYRLFCQKQARNDAMPPTKDSLAQHIKRAGYQSFIWKRSLEANPNIPSPDGHGWHVTDGVMDPTLMTQPAAPNTLLELVRCGCKKGCTKNCKCAKNSLACTQACSCYESDNCLNATKMDNDDTESDSDDE